MILAVSPEGVIGAGGTIPWRYPGDLKRFKRLTIGSTIVMGRVTFESIGKALPGRRNIVVTRRPIEAPGVESVGTVEEALALAGDGDVWFIGGARIYEGAMAHVDVIDVTYVPDRIDVLDAVLAPPIDERIFEASPIVAHEDEPALTRRTFRRR
ncbi:MAG TPA: dihydrofolate reductase [Polyangiaceae bacterium]|nr:dihydrofolate reductase [Polyangiaceae bacterium]